MEVIYAFLLESDSRPLYHHIYHICIHLQLCKYRCLFLDNIFTLTLKNVLNFFKVIFEYFLHCKLRFISSIRPTFKQLEQAVQYTCRQFNGKRDSTRNESSPSSTGWMLKKNKKKQYFYETLHFFRNIYHWNKSLFPG